MKKSMKFLSTILCVGVLFAPAVGAYCVGTDKFTKEEYKKFEHNVFSKDTYKFLGQTITQKQAEMLTDLYKRVFDDVETNGQESEMSKKTYLKTARIFLEYTNELYQKIATLKHSRR